MALTQFFVGREALSNRTIPESIAQRLAARSARSRMFRLSQKNVYIFPTRQGFAFLALLILMLVTAINYQSSLIYLFSFLLGAVFFISIWLCFLNLSGLQISSFEQAECFAGQACPFHVRLFSEHHAALAISIGTAKDALSSTHVQRGATVDQTIFGKPAKRGLQTLKRLRLESTFPFGMIIAWTWLKLDAKTMVYPKPIQSEHVHLGSVSEAQDEDLPNTEELSDLKHYQQGDASNRIVWKHFAAKDQLVVRSYEAGGTDPDWIKWDDYDTGNTELKLSFLCFDVLDASQQNRSFGLDIPGQLIRPGAGEAHRRKCLTALALYSQSGANHEH